MAQLSTLLDRVHDELPAVPQALALRALSDAAKEFCSKTHAWQERLPSINVRADRTMYELDMDEGIQLVAFLDVRLDGEKIHPVATELRRLRQYDPPPMDRPIGFVQWHPGSIELLAPLTDRVRLDLTAALTLKLGATEVDVPDSLLDEYGEVIASGAKGRLTRMVNQPWYSPDAAVAYMGPFYQAMIQAKGRAMTALGSAQLQVEQRRWV